MHCESVVEIRTHRLTLHDKSLAPDLEGIALDPEDLDITQTNVGYDVGVRYDNRTSYIADISFLVEIDEQIEIRR